MSEQRLTTGEVLARVGRYAEARAEVEASLATLDRLLKPGHPWSGLRLRVLGQIDLGVGQPRAALASFERARALLSPSDPSLAHTRADIDFGIARALTALHQDPARARALAESARAALADCSECEAARQPVEAWLTRHPLPAAAGRRPSPGSAPAIWWWSVLEHRGERIRDQHALEIHVDRRGRRCLQAGFVRRFERLGPKLRAEQGAQRGDPPFLAALRDAFLMPLFGDGHDGLLGTGAKLVNLGTELVVVHRIYHSEHVRQQGSGCFDTGRCLFRLGKGRDPGIEVVQQPPRSTSVAQQPERKLLKCAQRARMDILVGQMGE